MNERTSIITYVPVYDAASMDIVIKQSVWKTESNNHPPSINENMSIQNQL